ncbi:MAG: GDSL-type esterase/lipase family protein [Verrucomicrobiota bacterium JB024]|nr:GDSL-type esterase/lipase family protein [Verrucomicrobiota bacterium JB024]
MISSLSRFIVGCLAFVLGYSSLFADGTRKPDLAAYFDKLEAGEAVTVVTLGGSITMHRTGWAQRIVEKMREAYPHAQVNFVNAGISGTGSNFGLFRLERDVMSYHPDLVFIEYAVNDGGADDASCVRNLESIVTRLRAMESPPALVFVESAAKLGSNHKRHNRVAARYNILDVNMQAAAEARLAETGGEWESLYSDNVHPNETGHALYAETLWQAMRADLALPAGEADGRAPVEALSQDALILDGALVVPNFQLGGWDYLAESGQGWWRKYFEGSLQTGPDAQPIHLPFYGRTIGLALLTSAGSGKLRVAVDGKYLTDIDAHRDWYYSIYVHPRLLEAGWHVLSLLPMEAHGQSVDIHIGYLLTQDQTTAPEIPSVFWNTTWDKSQERAVKMAKWEWRDVPVDAWQVIGPFGGEEAETWRKPQAGLDRDYGIDPAAVFAAAEAVSGRGGQPVRWQPAEGSGGWVDLEKMYDLSDRGVAYARVRIEAGQDGTYTVGLAADYFVYVYVNGERVASFLEGHGSATKGVPLELPLKAGVNDICLKIHSGSQGFGFRLELPVDEDLSVLPAQE